MRRGLFISFEGGEGAGKTTQARLLAGHLRRRRVPVVHTREPGGTSIAEAVRRILLHPKNRIAPMTELFLYEAARAQHLAEIVHPALEAGRLVICERYTDATEAYQGYGRGLDLTQIRALNRIATGNLLPDLTFLLDVPVKHGLRAARRLAKPFGRRGSRSVGGDRMERESAGFHERVRRGYLALARGNPGRFRPIAWGGTVPDVHRKIVNEVEQVLDRARSNQGRRARKEPGQAMTPRRTSGRKMGTIA